MISKLRKIIYSRIEVFFGAIIIIVVLVVLIGDKPTKTTHIVEEQLDETSYFDNLIIQASAVFVWDVNKKEEIFSLNKDTQLPLASLTKLMTAITATDILPESSIVTIEGSSLAEEGDSGLYVNEKWNFKELLSFMLVVSSNDGASAIASVAGFSQNGFPSKEEDNRKTFIQAMNEKAREVGLTQTYFINHTGLDTNEVVSGGYGSARDVAMLLEYAFINTPEIVEPTRHIATIFDSLSDINHIANNTNSSINAIPGLIASKTGFTDLAGGNLVIAFDAGMNRPIIISILGSTQEGRFQDVEKLVDASLNSL